MLVRSVRRPAACVPSNGPRRTSPRCHRRPDLPPLKFDKDQPLEPVSVEEVRFVTMAAQQALDAEIRRLASVEDPAWFASDAAVRTLTERTAKVVKTKLCERRAALAKRALAPELARVWAELRAFEDAEADLRFQIARARAEREQLAALMAEAEELERLAKTL